MAALDRAYQEDRHTVGAAVRTATGDIHVGVNVDTVGYGPCAEPVAFGAAVAAGQADVRAIVAVGRPPEHRILAPCGNCRQLLAEYAPRAFVILETAAGARTKVRASDLLPEPYLSSRAVDRG